MLRDLFINTTILIAFIFIGGQMARNQYIDSIPDKYKKTVFGAACGILGVTLICFSIQVMPGTVVDLRLLAVMISSLYGGILSSLISAAIISIFRLVYSGVTFSSIAAIINIMVLVIGCTAIARLRGGLFKKWLGMLILSCLTFCITVLVILIRRNADSGHIYTVLSSLTGALLIAGFITFYILEYIRNSNSLLAKFKEQSTRDFLTGLNNIRQFDTSLNYYIKRVTDNNEMLSLLLIDIDHFKNVNDTYGHPAGDAVLKQLGNVLVSACRSFDSVSRNGGEEFSILLPDCPNSRAVEVAERVRNAVKGSRFILPDNRIINITVSIGVSSYPETTQNPDDLFRHADGALYKAKRSGRNKVCSVKECIEYLPTWLWCTYQQNNWHNSCQA